MQKFLLAIPSDIPDLCSTAIALLRTGSIFTSIVTNDMSDIRRVRRQQGEADCQLSDALQDKLESMINNNTTSSSTTTTTTTATTTTTTRTTTTPPAAAVALLPPPTLPPSLPLPQNGCGRQQAVGALRFKARVHAILQCPLFSWSQS